MNKFGSILVGVTALCSFQAHASIGGYMESCYTGTGFMINKVCAQATSTANAAAAGNPITLSATAQAMYLERNGSRVGVDVELSLADHNNFFQPDAAIPVIVRAVICSIHRSCSYRVETLNTHLDRIQGSRTLVGTVSFDMRNEFPNEYAELLEKIEVLVPGVESAFTVTFPFGRSSH